jgi:ABC-type xylose transport system permease subunit
MTHAQVTVLKNAQRDWNIIVNAISCVLLILILNYVRKVKSNANITSSDSTQNYVEAKQVRVNTLVTVAHIAAIAGYLVIYTLVLMLKINKYSTKQRLGTSIYFFTGLLDLFLSFMLWFILYDKK